MTTTTSTQVPTCTTPSAMTSSATTPSAMSPTGTRRSVWRHGVVAAVAASATTTVLAAAASVAGVTFADQTGASIPIAGFAQLTLVFSLVGVGIAAIMARKAHRPRRTFVRTTLVLAVLSIVPDLTFGFDAGSAATLITLHAVAAAIVVPALAARLARSR
jgi:amino acid transporter